MSNQHNQWWKDPVSMQEAVNQYGTPTGAAKALGGISEHRARVWAKQFQTVLPSASYATPTAPAPTVGATELIIDQTQVKWTDSDLLAYHNIDPDTHIVVERKPKRWNQAIGDGQVAEMNALALRVVPKITPDMILPAKIDGPRFEIPGKRSYTKTHPKTILMSCDWHAPYQDKGFESCYLQLMRDLEPDEEWDIGDLMDLPSPSRHRTTKGFEATPQECVNERYDMDLRRCEASPGTIKKRLLGNHDVRVDIAIQEKIGTHVSRLCPAHTDIPLHDIGVALRYDELGIELVRPNGDYHSVLVQIAEGLSAAHGTKSGPHGGAIKRMARRNDSHISAHDHKQLVTQHISYDDLDDPIITISASIGCGCSRALARSYSEDADIHIGCALVTDHRNGVFNIEPARYDDRREVLIFRGKVYTP